MHYCDCTVIMHDGRFRHRKTNVTVPEIILLRHMHGGEDRVVDIEIVDVKKLPSAKAEKDRLMAIYGGKEKWAKLIEQLFPGAIPRLPNSVREIETDVELLNARDPKGLLSAEDAAIDPTAHRVVRTEAAPPAPAEGETGDLVILDEGEDEDSVIQDGQLGIEDRDDIEDYSFLNDLKNVGDKQVATQ